MSKILYNFIRWSKLFWSAVLFFASGVNVIAQNQEAAFEKIGIHFSYQLNTNRNYFHDYWKTNGAYHFDFNTPFYFGEFFTGMRYSRFTERVEDVPGIDNFQFSVGWGLKSEVLPNLKIGAAVGTIFSSFRYDILTEEQKNAARRSFGSKSTENETGFLIRMDVSYSFSKSLGIRLQADRSIVYTKNKIKLNYIGVGVYRNFESPGWLMRMLR